jgi:hypothetical protein
MSDNDHANEHFTYPKADTSKGSCHGSNKRIDNSSTTASILSRRDPPISNDSGNSDMDRVLEDLMREEEG